MQICVEVINPDADEMSYGIPVSKEEWLRWHRAVTQG